jgi:hypothetical protein
MTSLPDAQAKLKPLDSDTRVLILRHVIEGDRDGAIWAEKVRRFCSLYGRNLKSAASQRFGQECRIHLEWMCQILVEGAWRSRACGEAPVDSSFIGAALYAADAMAIASDRIEGLAPAFDALRAWLDTGPRLAPIHSALGAEFDYESGQWKREAARLGKVILFSPNPVSLYSIAVLHLCQQLEIEIAAVVVRQFTLHRFQEELGRDGFGRLTNKIWRKLILRNDEYPDAARASLRHVYDNLAIPHGSVGQYGAALGVPVLEVREFDDAAAELKKLNPSMGLFTGGGMMNSTVLAPFEHGVVNVHMGHLPQYKGLDVTHAPLIEGRPESVGLTAHFMVRTLDAGPVLLRYTAQTQQYETLGTLRNELSALMPLVILDAALGIASGRINPVEQPEAGRQYYFLHPDLLSLVQSTLKSAHDGSANAGNDIEGILARFAADYASW